MYEQYTYLSYYGYLIMHVYANNTVRKNTKYTVYRLHINHRHHAKSDQVKKMKTL